MNDTFSYFDGTLEEFLQIAPFVKDRLIKCRINPVSDQPYIHVIDNYAFHHIMRRHGSKREYLRGQVPVTASDFLRIESIISYFDTVTPGKCRNGNDAFIYSKEIGGEVYTLVQEVRKGHNELAVSTLYKQKKKETHRR